MKLLSAACSDRGIKKKINQDSLLVRSAMTKEGEILLAAVCDGMGGLEKRGSGKRRSDPGACKMV